MTQGRLYVGTSGYQYRHWRGVFYPEDLRQADWFDYYTSQFDVVEINNSFYRLPSHETFDAWKAAAPEGFCYVLKFSRYGSHLKKLKHPENSVTRFMDGARRLGDALGPILVQLPGNWRVNIERLREFLDALPPKQRFAFEFRHPSWLCEEVYELLERHHAALVEHDMLPDHPRRITADFVYWRFHGQRYRGNYSPQHLSARARRAADELAAGRDVYAFFNNDAEGYAPANARDLVRYIERLR